MNGKTLILGNGSDARDMAVQLLKMDRELIVAASEDAGNLALLDDLDRAEGGKVEILPITGCSYCYGTAGAFRLMFSTRDRTAGLTVSTIILADDAVREPNYILYHLKASPGVVSLSGMDDLFEFSSASASGAPSVRKIAFISGLASESHPVITEEVMRRALRLQRSSNRQTYIYTGNLKVAGNGLEALYRETKKAGTIYIKMTESMPEFQQTADDRVTITYEDEITREAFKLIPDLVVVDETISPSKFTMDLSQTLGIDSGPDRFAQSDNVHRNVVGTNRKGIFVSGFARGVQADWGRSTDAGNAALSVIKCFRKEETTHLGKADIDNGRCVRCLTCFRICPYAAITLNTKVAVDIHSCEGCGICAAECPAHAITLVTPDNGSVAQRIPGGGRIPASGAFSPSIIAFCCARSAVGAGELATRMGRRLPEGLNVIEVPCAGSVSVEHLLAAFSRGADGVLVLTCHADNCHSEKGNLYARQRVSEVGGLMTHIGLEPERLACNTLASNMGAEFAEVVSVFEKRLCGLGPSRLKR